MKCNEAEWMAEYDLDNAQEILGEYKQKHELD